MTVFQTALKAAGIEAPDVRSGAQKLRENLAAAQAGEMKTTPAPAVPASSLSVDAKNNEKRRVYDELNRFVKEGKEMWESMTEVAITESAQNQDPGLPQFSQNHRLDFLDDPLVTLSMQEAATAKKQKEAAKKEAQGYAANLRKRWDTSIKNNINMLTNLAMDPRYMEWLSTLGIAPNDMVQLSKGRESYINNFTNQIRKELNDDITWMENLDRIKLQAEKEYNAKARTMIEEARRVQERKPDVLHWQTKMDGSLVAIVQDPVTGQLHEEVVGGGYKTSTGATGVGLAFSVPPSGKSGIVAGTAADGTFEINFPQDYAAKGRYRNIFGGPGIMCGELVNDCFGKTVIGDTIAEKLKAVSPFVQAIDQVMPGMGFVIRVADKLANGRPNPNAKYGHTGMVVKNNGDNTVTTLEANWKGGGEIAYYTRNIRDILTRGGFVINPNVDISESRGLSTIDALVEWNRINDYGSAAARSERSQLMLAKREELLRQGVPMVEAERRAMDVFREEQTEAGGYNEQVRNIVNTFVETTTPENFLEELAQAVTEIQKLAPLKIKDIRKEKAGVVEVTTAEEQIRTQILKILQGARPDLQTKAMQLEAAALLAEKESPSQVISAVEKLLNGFTNEEGQQVPPFSPAETAEILNLSGVLQEQATEFLEEPVIPSSGREILKRLSTALFPPLAAVLKWDDTYYKKLENLFKKRGADLKNLL